MRAIAAESSASRRSTSASPNEVETTSAAPRGTVRDLDLGRTRAQADERVDVRCHAYSPRRSRPDLDHRARSTCSPRRVPARLPATSRRAATDEHAVVLEDERSLGLRAGEPRKPLRELGCAIRVDERGDPLQLVVGRIGVPPSNRELELRAIGRGGSVQRNDFEQTVDGVADLRRGETSYHTLPVHGHAGEPSTARVEGYEQRSKRRRALWRAVARVRAGAGISAGRKPMPRRGICHGNSRREAELRSPSAEVGVDESSQHLLSVGAVHGEHEARAVPRVEWSVARSVTVSVRQGGRAPPIGVERSGFVRIDRARKRRRSTARVIAT